ncbi:hypothetical protein [Parasphingorhabdus pacifica]
MEFLELVGRYLNADWVSAVATALAFCVAFYSATAVKATKKSARHAEENAAAAMRSASAAEEGVDVSRRSAAASEAQAATAATQSRLARESIEVAKEQVVDLKAPRIIVQVESSLGECARGLREPLLSSEEPPAPHPPLERLEERPLSHIECNRLEVFYIARMTLYNDGDRAVRFYTKEPLYFYQGNHPVEDRKVGIPVRSAADDFYAIYPKQHVYLEMRPRRSVHELAAKLKENNGDYGDRIFKVVNLAVFPGVEMSPRLDIEFTFGDAIPIKLRERDGHGKVYLTSHDFIDVIVQQRIED